MSSSTEILKQGQALLQLADTQRRSNPAEAKKNAEQARECARVAGDDGLAARALFLIAEFHFRRGEFGATRELSEEGLTLGEHAGDAYAEHKNANLLGLLARQAGDHQEATRRLQQSLAAAERLGDTEAQALALDNLGIVRADAGEFTAAIEMHQQAVALRERSGSSHSLGLCYTNLATTFAYLGRWSEAIEHYYRALVEHENNRELRGMAACYINISEMYIRHGNARRARELADMALHAAELAGAPLERLKARRRVAQAEGMAGDLPRARSVLLDNVRAAEELGVPHEIALNLLAWAGLRLEELGAADPESGSTPERVAALTDVRAQLGRAEEIIGPSGPAPIRSSVLRLQGQTLRALGEPGAAEACLQSALELARRPTAGYEQAQVQLEYARLLVGLGRPAEGEALVREALGVFRRLDVRAEIEAAREFLARLDVPPEPEPVRAVEPDSAATTRRFPDFVGTAAVLSPIYDTIEQVAPSKMPVLIRGERGTGRHVVARIIARASPRRDEPFVILNCAEVPEKVLEIELFGSGSGAGRPGLIEEARRGTLFIEEIGDLPCALQERFLQVLQEQMVQRAGDDRRIAVDVRVIAATSRDLEAEVGAGRLLDDLYRRLNVVAIQLPRLRERKEDIPALVEHFVAKYCREFERPRRAVTVEALAALTDYDWPGDVRELEDVIERATILSRGPQIERGDLPRAVQG